MYFTAQKRTVRGAVRDWGLQKATPTRRWVSESAKRSEKKQREEGENNFLRSLGCVRMRSVGGH